MALNVTFSFMYPPHGWWATLQYVWKGLPPLAHRSHSAQCWRALQAGIVPESMWKIVSDKQWLGLKHWEHNVWAKMIQWACDKNWKRNWLLYKCSDSEKHWSRINRCTMVIIALKKTNKGTIHPKIKIHSSLCQRKSFQSGTSGGLDYIRRAVCFPTNSSCSVKCCKLCLTHTRREMTETFNSVSTVPLYMTWRCIQVDPSHIWNRNYLTDRALDITWGQLEKKTCFSSCISGKVNH